MGRITGAPLSFLDKFWGNLALTAADYALFHAYTAARRTQPLIVKRLSSNALEGQ